MRDEQIQVPDDDDLARWIRSHPEVWKFADEPAAQVGDAWIDRTIDDIVSGARERRRRRHRRRWAGAFVGVGLVAGGATAAALWLGEQPSRPESGAACRATAAAGGDAIVIAPGQDLIEACAARWVDGVFGEVGAQTPALVACVNNAGSIDVVPGDESTCESLGLASAAPQLSDDNEAIVELQDRFIAEINAVECRPVGEVVTLAEKVLQESGLSEWVVVVEPASVNGICGKAAVDSPTRTVTIHEF